LSKKRNIYGVTGIHRLLIYVPGRGSVRDAGKKMYHIYIIGKSGVLKMSFAALELVYVPDAEKSKSKYLIYGSHGNGKTIMSMSDTAPEIRNIGKRSRINL